MRLISQSVLSTLVPFLHPLHSAALSDLVDLHKPDLVCLPETWMKPTTTYTELINCTPIGYTFVSNPRNFTKRSSSTGGGTSFLIRLSSFESSFLTLKLPHSNLSVFNICRPPSSSTCAKPSSVFSANLVPSFLQRLLLFLKV